MAYWSQGSYIGIGSGATGSVYSFSGGGGLRWTNSRDIERYCGFWQSTPGGDADLPRETERLTLELEEEEFLMMGFRSVRGVSSGDYRRRFAPLSPWRGDLSSRLGVRSGAWERFSSRRPFAGGCHVEEEEDGRRYYFTGSALAFLNSFLRLLT